MKTQAYPRTAARSLRISDICACVYCLLASKLVLQLPIYGGALYMCAQVSRRGFALLFGHDRHSIPRANRLWRALLLGLMLLTDIALLLTYPFSLWNTRVWLLVILICCMLVRDSLSARLYRRYHGTGIRRGWFYTGLALTHLIPLCVAMAALAFHLDAPESWLMLAGYAVCDLTSLYALISDHAPAAEGEDAAGDAQEVRRTLLQTNAYKVYEALSTLLVIAVHLMLLLLMTLGLARVTAETILLSLGLMAGLSLLSRELTQLALAHREKRTGRPPETALMMLTGVFLLIYALMSLRHSLGDRPLFYVCLACFTAGCTLCAVSMARMESAVEKLAVFAGVADLPTYRRMRTVALDSAALAGQMLALVGLTVLFSRITREMPDDLTELFASFQPMLILPPLILLAAALVFTLRFPISNRLRGKLERYLSMPESDNSYATLRRDLEGRVIQRRKQAYGIRIIRFFVRIFYRQKVTGAENIRPDPENPLVFLCNHGEFFGPVACVCYIPVPMRVWSIDRMTDITIGKEYLYKYTVSHIGFIPETLKMPVAGLLARLSRWCMSSLDTIPVYRDKPTQLMKTFRLSVDAMQSGDNLLIFPENPNALAYEHGYEREGVGELFTGFAMLGTIYHSRTGKRCRFLPLFAHKGNRTLAFGHEIVFDPDNDPAAERERISAEASAEMKRLYQEQEALRQGRGG